MNQNGPNFYRVRPIFQFVSPPPKYVMRLQLKSTCHYMINHCKNMARASGGANIMLPLSGRIVSVCAFEHKRKRSKRGGGTKTEKNSQVYYADYFQLHRKSNGLHQKCLVAL